MSKDWSLDVLAQANKFAEISRCTLSRNSLCWTASIGEVAFAEVSGTEVLVPAGVAVSTPPSILYQMPVKQVRNISVWSGMFIHALSCTVTPNMLFSLASPRETQLTRLRIFFFGSEGEVSVKSEPVPDCPIDPGTEILLLLLPF